MLENRCIMGAPADQTKISHYSEILDVTRMTQTDNRIVLCMRSDRIIFEKFLKNLLPHAPQKCRRHFCKTFLESRAKLKHFSDILTSTSVLVRVQRIAKTEYSTSMYAV